MRRPWPLLTAVLCALMILATLAASNRAQRADAVVERDGYRTLHRRALGFFPSSREVRDPSIHVSDDLKAVCRRLGIRLSPETMRLLPSASRQWMTEHQDQYSLYGEVGASPSRFVQGYAAQLKSARRTHSGNTDQLNAIASDGRTMIDIYAFDSGGSTWINLGIGVYHSEPTPRPTDL